jgi:predicted O-methyltransferase YrrM
MIERLQQLARKFLFYVKAADGKGHGTHSPFVYQFITEVLNDDRYFYAYEEIGLASDNLRKDKSTAAIRKQLPKEKYNKLFFRIVAYYEPSCIIELGVSLGVTTAYLASPNENIKLYNIENDILLSNISTEIPKKLQLKNVIVSAAQNFPTDNLQKHKGKPGLIVINNASVDYIEIFESLLGIIGEENIIIITGINKSLGNRILFTKLKNQSKKTFSINLFEIGIIFFRREVIKKQDFEIRF